MSDWGAYAHQITASMALFRESNRRLVELAALSPGMSVLDLACGSGLTALSALEQVPAGLTLHLLDQDAAMIEAARHHLGDQVVVYHTADAAQGAALGLPKLDRVLCNLSFWYFRDPHAVLQMLRRMIKPTGRLCFSLSGTYFNTGGGVVSPQWAFMRALKERGLIPRSLPAVERLPNQRSIEATLLTNGFKPFAYDLLQIASTRPETEQGGELHSLLQLYPVMPGANHQEAVANTLALLPEVAEEIAAFAPQWRTVTFMAQPQVDPTEALLARLKQ
jgi:ubiquinone/menaquinone biosynthesis C-methylase UbiE